MKSQENHSESVKGGQQHPGQQQPENQPPDFPADRPAAQPDPGQNFILAPESGQRDDAHQTEAARQGKGVSPGHIPAQPAHIAHIKSAAGVVDAARSQEQQRLEKGVGEQVEQSRPKSPHPQSRHHISQLADRGIGHHPLYIVHHQAQGGGHKSGEPANQRHHGQGFPAFLKQGIETGDQKDAGRHHRSGMNQGAYRRRPFHRVRQPGMQGELPRFAGGSGKNAQGYPGQSGSPQNGPAGRQGLRRLPKVRDVQGIQPGRRKPVGLKKQVNNRQQKPHIADAGNDKGFLGRRGRRRPVMPEPD